MDDFEKLTIAKLHIKKLLFENGVLQSEIDELKHENDLLKNPKLDTNEKISFKQGVYYGSLKNKLHHRDKVIRKLRKDNQELICKLAQNRH